MGSDGRYVFRSCVPAGPIDIANVRPGESIDRAFTFRVNEPPDHQSLLDNGIFDPRNIARGYDGELFDGDGNFLAEVNTWQAQYDPRTTDYQPSGSKLVWAIPQGYTVTLTFTETVVRDTVLLARVLAGVQNGTPDATLNFQGVIRSRAA